MQKIAILYDASQAVLSTFDLDEVCSRSWRLRATISTCRTSLSCCWTRRNRNLHPRCQIGWDPGHDTIRLPIGTGTDRGRRHAEASHLCPDVSQRIRITFRRRQSTRSELAIPLMVRDEVVGVLDCQSENLDHFDYETIDLLTLFSTQASMALQNAQLYSLERQRAPQLEAINAIARETTAVLDQKELLIKVCSVDPARFPGRSRLGAAAG